MIVINKPVARARYDFANAGEPMLEAVVDAFLERLEPEPGSA